MTREFSTVGVVGLGTMGAGIAEVFARSGLEVVALEISDEALAGGQGHVTRSTDRAVTRGRLADTDRTAIIDRIRYTTSFADLAACELVVEAVPERMELKTSVFAQLDAVCPPDAILATNTSSLSVTEIAVSTSRPTRVVGMHFFNPAPVMRLVEVISTVVTDPEVTADVESLAGRVGKSAVSVSDRAGFIANALLFGYLNHAVALLDSHHASREDIDAAMTLGCGLPMGPLALLDLIGIDTAYQILGTMYWQSRDRLHAPHPLIRELMTAGLLGRKTGRGFYTYEQSDSHTQEDPEVAPATARIGVVGTRPTASGLADVFAAAGYDVRHVSGTELADLADCDLVVEATAGELDATRALFAELDGIVKGDTILATTTARLPVVELAAATERPSRVVGLHFVDHERSRLVEVVHTVETAAEVVGILSALVRSLDKHPISCADRAGFVVDALLVPYLNDAVRMLEAQYATAEDIDTAMKLGCGYPVGPFELLDTIGLDVVLDTQRRIYTEYREPGWAPAPLLGHLVTAGYLGRTTGKGFRDHPS